MRIRRTGPILWPTALLLVSLAGTASPLPASSFTLGRKTVGEDGVIRYEIRSPYQSSTTSLRIMLPDRLDAKRDLASSAVGFLFILPVEAQGRKKYGDGLVCAKADGLHNLYNLILIEPEFASIPWYGDHPSDLGIRQESYMVKAIVPAVDHLFPCANPKRLLLGFSKSGWGAISLLLRHPDLFEGAAAWDAPLMIRSPDRYGMEQVFATQRNFNRYDLPGQFRRNVSWLQKRKRLALLGYGSFRDDMQQAHQLLDQLRIAHDYADGPQRPHRWDSGWVPQAVESLVAIARTAEKPPNE